MLEVRGLGHRYGDATSGHHAIGSLDFAVRSGEFVSIVGPSGSGKTTLLRIVTGLMRPGQGSVEVAGRPVSGGVPEDVAVVFQDYSRSLFAWMSVRRNVAFPLRNARCSRDERTAESLAAVGLTDFAGRYPWQLSGGMQQRVAIARALAYRPKLLLMDEPFASVDAQTRADLEDLALQVHERFGTTILFVTHDIDESVYLSDRVLVLSSPPARLLADVQVDLPRPRDQLATRQLPEFVRLRAEVAGLLLRQRDPRDETGPAVGSAEEMPAWA
ncbi:MAG: ABC transporter ATP-binding protein [Actinobacteria bacterium]|nr:ABC transporter ATP-binding protein [Actinomycetota bacterium]